jgi:hypothetical protein
MNIDPTLARFLLDAAQTVFIVLLWLRKPGQDAARAAEAVKGRVDVLEERLKHMPTSDELSDLEGTVKAIKASMDGLAAAQLALAGTAARIEHYLLNHRD